MDIALLVISIILMGACIAFGTFKAVDGGVTLGIIIGAITGLITHDFVSSLKWGFIVGASEWEPNC